MIRALRRARARSVTGLTVPLGLLLFLVCTAAYIWGGGPAS